MRDHGGLYPGWVLSQYGCTHVSSRGIPHLRPLRGYCIMVDLGFKARFQEQWVHPGAGGQRSGVTMKFLSSQG